MHARRLIRLAAACLVLWHAPQAGALEFRSVHESGAVLYQAPSLAAKKLFVVSRYYPVEVLTRQGDWVRVRDATGAIAWMQATALTAQRMVLVVADRAAVHAAPDAASPLVFSIPKNGVLHLVTVPKGGWVQVRHRDGGGGYVQISDLWGL